MINEHEDEIEEDFSSLLSNSNPFSRSYEEEHITIRPLKSFKLKCISDKQMTPLNVVDSYSSEDHDATGHHVWLASYFFLDAMIRPLRSKESDLHEIRKEIFCRKRVLELGCGTGIAGLALKVANVVENDEKGGMDESPLELFMTDADEDALKLCRQNFEMNNLTEIKDSIFFHPLSWGTTWWMDEGKTCDERSIKGKLLKGSFHTVFASDVVYDLEALPLLMKTASEALCSDGKLVLSHVPRFASTSVEKLIVEKANDFGISLIQEWRPKDIYDPTNDGSPLLKDLEEKDAVLFLFKKQ